jgi:Tol biopolymer transport system component
LASADPEIAYVDRTSPRIIKVMNSDGSNQRTVYTHTTATQPSMSPDGRQVVFAATINGQKGVYVINSDGTGLRLVTPLLYKYPDLLRPTWSPVPAPDGQSKLLFLDYDHLIPVLGIGPRNLFVVNLDGTGRLRLTNDVADEGYAEWSHDATHIVFVKVSLQMAQLGLVNGQLAITGTTELSQITGSPLQAATSLAFSGGANTGNGFLISAITPDSAGKTDLWLVTLLNPGQPVRLTNTKKTSETWATFSPDDGHIYYYLDNQGIMVMTSSGTGITLVNANGWRPNHRRR